LQGASLRKEEAVERDCLFFDLIIARTANSLTQLPSRMYKNYSGLIFWALLAQLLATLWGSYYGPTVLMTIFSVDEGYQIRLISAICERTSSLFYFAPAIWFSKHSSGFINRYLAALFIVVNGVWGIAICLVLELLGQREPHADQSTQ
jgi:hypothetical protein